MRKGHSEPARALLRQHSTAALKAGLASSTPIRYRSHGNRGIDSVTFLSRLEGTCARLGTTRVAEISQLTGSSFPVYQSTRPGLMYHATLGQNSGSQGKAQVYASCHDHRSLEDLRRITGAPARDLQTILAEWCERKTMFEHDGRYLSLARRDDV